MKILKNSMYLNHFCRLLTGSLLLLTVLGYPAGSAWSEPTTPAVSPQPVASPKPKVSPQPTISPIAKKIATLKKSNQRWIEVNLAKQRLFAWDGKKQIHAVVVSTGKASTPTVTGLFAIQDKQSLMTLEGDDYVVPNVPSVMFFSGGYAIHGAYWHNRFGTPVSHGCINVAVDHAEWLFNWASVGTPVVVHD
jgi:lipoprotein-anchoring transpeptidase ErfK/SrfK